MFKLSERVEVPLREKGLDMHTIAAVISEKVRKIEKVQGMIRTAIGGF